MAAANSPHRFVGQIRTPMLVIHGDKDYRVPIGEALRLWYELLTESGLPAADDGTQPAPVPLLPVGEPLGAHPAARQDLVPGGDRVPGRTCWARTSSCPRRSGSVAAMSAAQREFDIVLYGATGFVGKLTAEYLARAGGGRPHRAGRPVAGQAARGAGLAGGRGAVLAADHRRRVAAVDAERDGRPDPGGGDHGRALRPLRPAVGRGMCRGGNRLRRPDRRAAVHPREHRPATTSRPSTPVRASCIRADSIPSLRISPSSRCTAGPQQDGAGELGDTNLVVRAFAGGVSGGTVASMIEVLRTASADPEARRADERSLHADPRPRGRTRTRRPARHAVAPRPRDRAGTGRLLGRRVRDGRRRTPESSGAATHYWTTRTAGGSSTPSR